MDINDATVKIRTHLADIKNNLITNRSDSKIVTDSIMIMLNEFISLVDKGWEIYQILDVIDEYKLVNKKGREIITNETYHMLVEHINNPWRPKNQSTEYTFPINKDDE